MHIAALNQEFEVDPRRTVREEFWTVFTEANKIQQALAEIPLKMENADPDELEKLINQLDKNSASLRP